jgi:hypothetical protein
MYAPLGVSVIVADSLTMWHQNIRQTLPPPRFARSFFVHWRLTKFSCQRKRLFTNAAGNRSA